MDGPEPPSTNPELAALLAAAYRDVDTLRKHVASLQKRADKGDRFAEVIHALGCAVSPDQSPSSSPQGPSGAPATNGSANPTADTPSTPTPATAPVTLPGLHSLPPQFAQQLRQVVEMYEEKLAHVQGLLEESEARNKESWRQLDEILSSFQSHIHGARAIARTYVVDSTNGNHGLYTLGYTYTDSPTSAAFPSGVMGPPAPHHGQGHGASSSTSSSRHAHSGSGGSGSGSGSRALNATASSTGTTATAAVAFPLPPHPPLPHLASTSASMASLPHSHGFPAPQHQAAVGAGGVVGLPTRRPRTPSMDNLYASAQPPSKRSRAAAASMIEDKMRGMYDSYPTTGTQHRPLGPASTVPAPGSAFSDPHQHNHLPLHQQQQQQQQQHVQARIIDRKYRSPAAGAAGTTYVAHPLSHSQSLSHSQYTHVSSSGGVRGGGKDRNSGSRGSGRPGEEQGGQGHSRSGSHSSASSMDVDEMIIKASTEGGDGSTSIPPVNGTPVGPGAGAPARWGGEGSHLAGAHAHSFLVGGGGQQQQYSTSSHGHHRRRSDRDRDRDRESPASAGGANAYPASGQSFNAGVTGSGSAMRVLSDRDGGREGGGGGGRSYTQTVFAPVVTGAPTKKSKYPNSMGSSASLDTLANPGSSSSNLNPNSANPTANAGQQQPNKTTPYPATNDKGERICRTCGIVGRYKDGKCVEKWGPGVMGPGTVCDRCRKKAKRDEGRQVQQQQQQQLQPRSNSHAQLPLSQGSDRSIQRSDTILTHQPSSHSFIQSRNDRDPDSSPNLRSSTANSSATFKARAAPASTAGRHAPTPPMIASLREKHDDDADDDEDGDGGVDDGHNTAAVARGRDPEQLPTSNVGRGVAAVKAASSKNNSRSNSRNRRVRPGSAKPTPPATTESSHRNNGSGLAGALKKGSTSPSNVMIIDDEVDADADEDAEAEAEAEILGAVDAAASAEGDADDADGDGDGEGDLENDADADAELLEAVDAAEANSIGSSHGGDRSSWLKSEPI